MMKQNSKFDILLYKVAEILRNMSGKNRFLLGFVVVVVVLALARLVNPGLAESRRAQELAFRTDSAVSKDSGRVADGMDKRLDDSSAKMTDDKHTSTGQEVASDQMCLVTPDTAKAGQPSIFFDKDGKEVKHRIFSVPHFGNTFPDQQDVQILAANQFGVSPVQNRDEAEHSKGRLVYVGSNPFFYVDKLNNSIPYLVPRASVLLQDIGRAFYDSLQIKGIPLHKIITTSVLRTKDDVARLRTRNGNATENSCHLYGTTFDVCYNRYKTVQTADKPRRKVQNDTLKWVLSEVLRDFRERERCYVKYEVKQGCFHITVR